jgi:CheY-like chemotaxis protein
MVERQVLVVEDDVSLREAIIDTLELADCQCLEAANGEEALLILKNVDGISIIYLDDKDVIRHKLVKKVIDAYQNIEHQNQF